MSQIDQRAIVKRIVDEAYNAGDFAVLEEHIASDYSSELLPPGVPDGPNAFKVMITSFRTAFPDIHFEIDDQIAEQDKIVNRWTMRGTHRGSFMSVEATNRSIEVRGISIWYLQNDQVVDFWVVMDEAGLIRQIAD